LSFLSLFSIEDGLKAVSIFGINCSSKDWKSNEEMICHRRLV